MPDISKQDGSDNAEKLVDEDILSTSDTMVEDIADDPDTMDEDTSEDSYQDSDDNMDEDSSDDSDYDVSLQDDLNAAFKIIKTPGTFAAWGSLPTTPPAGLHVNGVADIALPLSEESVRRLIEKAHQAPFGRRSETLIDVSVRNTWEIDGDQLRFLDPLWQGYLLDLNKRVATSLGIDGPIRSELYKMLIYEQGAMFKPHTDTEKTPGMFGTMIICLPSPHTGGEVVVKHNGECKTLSTSAAKQSFACWYSDVTHEVLPVKSGYRCVLTYNLAIKPGESTPAASRFDIQKQPLRRTLRHWLRDLYNGESYLYHALEHEYTEASMSLQTLKAEDFARVRVVQDLTAELPFEIFLALLEKKEEGDCEPDWTGGDDEIRCRYGYNDGDLEINENGGDHVLDEVNDTSYSVKSLRALDGTAIASNFDFDEDCCTEEDPFEMVGVAREEYEAYHGNWGPSATHWYRRAALAIVPHESLEEFLTKCEHGDSKNANPILRYLGQRCSEPTASIRLLDLMAKLCRRRSGNRMQSETIIVILKAALQHAHYELFHAVATRHQGELPVSFADWSKEWINTLPEVDRADRYQRWIPLLIDAYPSMAKRTEFFERISQQKTDDSSVPDAVLTSQPWAQNLFRQSITNLLETTTKPAEEEGGAIVSSIFNLNDTWESTSTFLTSIFDRFLKVEGIAFLLGFLSQLKTLGTAAQYPISNTVELRRKLSLRLFNGERTPADIFTGVESEDMEDAPPEPAVCERALAGFFCDLYDLSADGTNLMEPFIEQINARCTTFSEAEMTEFWMPFLYQLISGLASRSVPLNTPLYQQLTRQFLQHYEEKCIGPMPHAGINTQSPQVSCRCADCKKLNKFLQDGSERVIQFKVAQKRRQHLAKKIDETSISCSHETQHFGSPLTLLVKKCRTLDEEINKWKSDRKFHYLRVCRSIKQEHLENLLGVEEAARLQSLSVS
ncbi:uncharacterized protein PGTG_11700 [Puccinia graminis f. sp. tritici CRL 75-36-700-3]|uniref:Prolyl 4-hydroxylase alpha subunit Fe(2+) 2OG dioxygenase domain-containing protein n=1 Tax=Puccinia graminis f. sp. tritici (strain CRL 75-36-700-3 / race SCCL) TaxID=418459 RepID=E3KNR9_PUCGT|nr:uncharacterized protein PGTG_11700 [Puccinia graminis f. sp. tritici CRL 75-36-700-3]EFP85944.1 hypothetical protein PGTG_11700 [Puccinia graminis f. sp. tritici CRL 75-36-700-3]